MLYCRAAELSRLYGDLFTGPILSTQIPLNSPPPVAVYGIVCRTLRCVSNTSYRYQRRCNIISPYLWFIFLWPIPITATRWALSLRPTFVDRSIDSTPCVSRSLKYYLSLNSPIFNICSLFMPKIRGNEGFLGLTMHQKHFRSRCRNSLSECRQRFDALVPT